MLGKGWVHNEWDHSIVFFFHFGQFRLFGWRRGRWWQRTFCCATSFVQAGWNEFLYKCIGWRLARFLKLRGSKLIVVLATDPSCLITYCVCQHETVLYVSTQSFYFPLCLWRAGRIRRRTNLIVRFHFTFFGNRCLFGGLQIRLLTLILTEIFVIVYNST